MDIGAGDMDWLRGRIFLKPEDQLQLTDVVCIFITTLYVLYVFKKI